MLPQNFDARRFIEEDSEGDGARALHKVPVGSIVRSLERPGLIFRVERSNGYVLSGISIYANESDAIDTRVERAEIVFLAGTFGLSDGAIRWVARRVFENAARFSDVVSRLQMVAMLDRETATFHADMADAQLRAMGEAGR